MSSAVRKPSRDVSRKSPSSSAGGANAAPFHQRNRPAGERDQRVGGNVERGAEALAGRVEERAVELGGRRERGAGQQEIEPAEFLIEAFVHRLDVIVGRDIAGQRKGRRRQVVRQLLDVVFEAPLIREREPGAARRRGLRDRPRDRVLVGHTDDQAALAREIVHVE